MVVLRRVARPFQVAASILLGVLASCESSGGTDVRPAEPIARGASSSGVVRLQNVITRDMRETLLQFLAQERAAEDQARAGQQAAAIRRPPQPRLKFQDDGSVVVSGSPAQIARIRRMLEELAESTPKDLEAGVARTVHWQRTAKRQTLSRVDVGNGKTLELERMRITVTIEGPRARTVVDHVYRNPHGRTLEGSFEYALPTGASPSYYAMFLSPAQDRVPELFPAKQALPNAVLATMPPARALAAVDEAAWGELREARVVHREKARRTYEEITRRNVDPAVLEHAGGNTFRGRVFPIQPKGLNRVVLAYDEHLDFSDGAVQYRLPLPSTELARLDVTIVVRESGWKRERLVPDTRKKVADGRIVYERSWRNAKPPAELLWAGLPRDARAQTSAGRDPAGKGRSFYVRVRPDLPSRARQGFARRAVFLLDTSFSEAPDRFRASVKILEEILKQDRGIEQFNVACFDVGATWLDPSGWVKNDATGRQRVLGLLDGILLEGATDLSAAIDLLDDTRWDGERERAYVFLLTDGQVNWGEQDPRVLATSLEECALLEPRVFCYRTGIGAENLALFGELTRRGGTVFNVLTENTAKEHGLAHRRPAFVLTNAEVRGAKDVLVAGRRAAVTAGGEILVAGRFQGTAPNELVLTGELLGKKTTMRFGIDLSDTDTLAERAWAELAVQQMLALEDPELEKLAVAYAQRYRIGTRVSSFLVLEKDSDYEEFGIAAENRRLAVRDLADLLAERYRERRRVPSRKDAWAAFLRSRGRAVSTGPAKQILALLHEQDCRLPPDVDCGALVQEASVPRAYLEGRSDESARLTTTLQEASRRDRMKRPRIAIRALSTIVEMHPGRSDVRRLVGYRLMRMSQAGAAAHVFDRVRHDRPFEPQSYRDLARSLEAAFRYPLAALQYEILLSGTWHGRFGRSLLDVVREDYLRLIRKVRRSGGASTGLRRFFDKRSSELSGDDSRHPDVRVTISWNTDNTDVDLWIVDPSGETCNYEHKTTKAGGALLDDLTSGYGPERFRLPNAPEGEYTVKIVYYDTNPNLLLGETHVDIVVDRRVGDRIESTRHNVVLREKGQAVEVCKVRL